VGNFDVYVIDADGGAPSRLTHHPADDGVACFSHDGRWIYFASTRSGRFEIWKMPAEGGEAIQVTRNGGYLPAESPDGKYLYYLREGNIWRLPIVGGEEERIMENVRDFFAVLASGIYFLRYEHPGGDSIGFLNLSTRKETTTATTLRPTTTYGGGVSVSPDGRYLLYSQVDQSGSDLMLVENFK
jgi:dipeptidyl aminopeptidase/acylaminoacyl peptidase